MTVPKKPRLAITATAMYAAIVVTANLPSPANADGRDHDRARQALLDGSVLPLADILAKVQRQYPGQVLEVELEPGRKRAGNDWIYEIKILSADGRLSKLRVNAQTAEILLARSRQVERMREQR